MCCSTGICSIDKDPDLVNFATMRSQLAAHSIKKRTLRPGPVADGGDGPPALPPPIARSLGGRGTAALSSPPGIVLTATDANYNLGLALNQLGRKVEG
jgi:hypothetical protein